MTTVNLGQMHATKALFITALDATLSTDESEESSSLSEGDSSRSSESEDFKESEEVNLQQENETSQSQEEPPYQGRKISKILSFVLIVSFVWHTFCGQKIIENKRQCEVQKLDYPC